MRGETVREQEWRIVSPGNIIALANAAWLGNEEFSMWNRADEVVGVTGGNQSKELTGVTFIARVRRCQFIV